jgi:hypothetical protein
MIEIILSERERGVIRQALVESFMGYAGRFFPSFLGVKVARLRALLAVFLDIGDGERRVSLPLEDWRLIYDVINAVLYELGQEELHTITGYHPYEFMNTACFIMANAYRRMCSYPFYTIFRRDPKLETRWKKHNAVVSAERDNAAEAIAEASAETTTEASDDDDSEADRHGLSGYSYFELLR